MSSASRKFTLKSYCPYDTIFINVNYKIRNNECRERVMIISERIFKIIKEKNITQAEFAKRVGIATSTVSEWKKKKTNPSADKIMDICVALDITPDVLLTGRGIDEEKDLRRRKARTE